MALTFGAVSSDRVDCGSAAMLDDLATMTVAAWVMPTTLTANTIIIGKGAGGTNTRRGLFIRLNGTGGNVEVIADRASADLFYVTTDTPLASTGAWYYLAWTFNSGGSAGSIAAIYTGTLAAAVAARAVSAIDGSGAFASDAADTLVLGNNSAAALAFPGRIATAQVWNRVLTLGELQAQQFRPHVTSGCVGFWHLGFNGTGTQPDWSGNGNAGTVTGATVANHVPLGPAFGYDVWRTPSAAAAAAAGLPIIAWEHARVFGG